MSKGVALSPLGVQRITKINDRVTYHPLLPRACINDCIIVEHVRVFDVTTNLVFRVESNRWGPSLEAYVDHICHALHLTPGAAPELSLALMYLDRATSAETPRSNGVPPVPFLQPRTVHRLVLAALLLATQTTQGYPLPVLMERVESLGIPPEQLSQMLQWMHGALGDPGYFVTLYSIQHWHQVLGETARSRELLQPAKKETTLQGEAETLPQAEVDTPLERREDTTSVASGFRRDEIETDEMDYTPVVGIEAA